MKKKSFEDYCKNENLEYLLVEWHYEKNGLLKPSDVSKTSRTKVFWRCSKCGFEWETQVASRAIGMTKCPECYRQWKALNKKLVIKEKI